MRTPPIGSLSLAVRLPQGVDFVRAGRYGHAHEATRRDGATPAVRDATRNGVPAKRRPRPDGPRFVRGHESPRGDPSAAVVRRSRARRRRALAARGAYPVAT